MIALCLGIIWCLLATLTMVLWVVTRIEIHVVRERERAGQSTTGDWADVRGAGGGALLFTGLLVAVAITWVPYAGLPVVLTLTHLGLLGGVLFTYNLMSQDG